MRVPSAVEQDQMARVRPDYRATPLDRIDVGGVRVVREDQLAARPGQVIGTEQQACQRIGINMALEPHVGSVLDVEHDAVPVIMCRHYRFVPGLPRQVEELLPIEPVEPGQISPDIMSVHSAT
jgi:hypothetical protein